MKNSIKIILHDGNGKAVCNALSLAMIGTKFQVDEVTKQEVKNWKPESAIKSEITFKDNVCCLHFGPVSMYAVYA